MDSKKRIISKKQGRHNYLPIFCVDSIDKKREEKKGNP
jgi:hypothetical protein